MEKILSNNVVNMINEKNQMYHQSQTILSE